MAQYLILIYGDPEAALQEANRTGIMEGHTAFMKNNADALLGGNALHPASTGTSIRPTGDGEFVVTDGPFVETKEALGGYYLVEATDLDAAITLAKQVPAPNGGLEVRPIFVFD